MTDSVRTRDLSPARTPLLGLALLGSALLTSACVDDDDPVSQLRTQTVARFAPSSGEVPLPNDLLFSGTTDLTLNVPVADPTNLSDPLIALSTADGWSTVAPIFVPFTRAIDPATVIGGSTVRVFEVTAFADPATPVGGPVVSADNELVDGVDYEVSVSSDFGNTAIEIQPLVPFAPSTVGGGNNVYMVTVTNGVTDTDGFAVGRDAQFRFAAETALNNPPDELAQLNGLVNSQLNAYAATTSQPREDVVVSFTFTTQSVGSTITTLFGIANGQEVGIINNLCLQLGTCGDDTATDPNSDAQLRTIIGAPLIGTASELLGGPVGQALIYGGIFQAPYYLSAAANTGNFTGLTNDPTPLISKWQARYAPVAGVTERNLTRFNPLPISTSSQQVPVLISVPDSAAIPMPANGYPVAIFQHGINGNRAAMLDVAEALANVGFACVSIDLPLHGIAPNEFLGDGVTSLFLGYDQSGDVWERTFGLDLLTEGAAPAVGPDGVADSSGAHFINLTDLAVSRDNLRQGVADLFNLKAALSSLTVLGMDVIDETQVHFIGHSLGGMVGTAFVANQTDLRAVTLAMVGSSIPYLLDGSVNYGPVVRAGLAANGVLSGTPDFANFLLTSQTVLDAADPINYTARVQANGTPIYLPEIIGGGANMSLPDLTVPNSVPGAPFAGTEPMISALGLASTSVSTSDIGGLQVAVRFIEGNHSTIRFPAEPGVTPTAEETAAWAELQSQMASFHQSLGASLTVTDGTVIQ
ncbi:MAG: hypothetical protein VX015_06440 [Planctomycetota bacterium]|nr:hypothetical protein [Planctomycetota bacterium]